MTVPAAEGVRRLRAPLLRWYARHRRDLPWRRTRDPYAIWVSEIMLQQTQVKTVVPYFVDFIEHFPDPASLAAADEEEVLGRWSGLGYYRRARALQAACRVVMERHDGNLPRDPEALLALPGIGRYTAGAIASIAFDRPEPVLDGNVRRVLSRWLAPGPGEGSDARLWEVAGTLVRGARPGDLNQALMELGALVCTPNRPRCGACPVRSGCRAHADGREEHYPVPPKSKPATRVRVGVAWIVRAGRVLIERPEAGGPLRGTWDLPAFELDGNEAPEPVVRHRLASSHALEVTAGPPLARLTHGIMNRRLTLEVVACRLLRGRVSGKDSLRWLDPRTRAAISGATRKVIRRLGDEARPTAAP